MASNEKRSYYAVIPANVRYDKSLSANAKLLYGEISALCNDKGYCWSTNKYFSDLFGVSQKSISKWISMLVSKKYIFVEMVYRKGTKEILERHLSVVRGTLEKRNDTLPMEEKFHTPMEEKFHTPMKEKSHIPMEEKFHTPMEEKFHTPMEEKFKENTTGVNTTGVNKSVSQSTGNTVKAEGQTDGQTDEIRDRLKKQIDYDYFEDNFPEDLSGVDVLIDCMVEMLVSPSTKINGYMQQKSILKSYIGKADSETVREFLGHMRGTKMRDIKNVRAYWKSAFINFLEEQALAVATI